RTFLTGHSKVWSAATCCRFPSWALRDAGLLAAKLSGTIVDFPLSNIEATAASCLGKDRAAIESGSKLPHSKRGSEPAPCPQNAEVKVRGGLLYVRGKRVAAFLAAICLVAYYGVSPALSEEIKAQLKTSVDATRVTIGDIVTVNLSVKHSPTVKVAFSQV